MHLVDPPSSDYVPGPKEQVQAPLLPDYVPRLEYPEYLALSYEEVPVKNQPYLTADSPIALSSSYIANSDLEEDLEDESEDGPTDYPADGGDDDDDSSRDDVNDEDEEDASKEDEDEEEEKEEHLAQADSTAVASLVVDPVPSAEEIELFDTDESAATPPPPIPLPLTLVSSLPLPLPSPLTTSLTDAGAPLGYRIAEIRLRTASPPPLPLSLP
ncbi:hypothetical protein Tco_0067770, partial [Tanacetum coccineum]